MTSDFFSFLKATPAMGRTFHPDEGAPGSTALAVINESFWRTHLVSDPQAVGRSIMLDGKAHVVVGVMPAGFLRGLIAMMFGPP